MIVAHVYGLPIEELLTAAGAGAALAGRPRLDGGAPARRTGTP